MEAYPLPLDERGWPFFEKAVSSLVKDPGCLWSLRDESQLDMEVTELVDSLRTQRELPMSPTRFERVLKARMDGPNDAATKQLVFTNGGDVAHVLDGYRDGFVEAFRSYRSLRKLHSAADQQVSDGQSRTSRDGRAIIRCTSLPSARAEEGTQGGQHDRARMMPASLHYDALEYTNHGWGDEHAEQLAEVLEYASRTCALASHQRLRVFVEEGNRFGPVTLALLKQKGGAQVRSGSEPERGLPPVSLLRRLLSSQ